MPSPADRANTVREALPKPAPRAQVDDLVHGRVEYVYTDNLYKDGLVRAALAALDALQTQAALGEALEHVLKGWESAYPESVFTPLVEGELKHAMRLCNSEDPNQSARLYAEWARHIVRCIRDEAEATA